MRIATEYGSAGLFSRVLLCDCKTALSSWIKMEHNWTGSNCGLPMQHRQLPAKCRFFSPALACTYVQTHAVSDTIKKPFQYRRLTGMTKLNVHAPDEASCTWVQNASLQVICLSCCECKNTHHTAHLQVCIDEQASMAVLFGMNPMSKLTWVFAWSHSMTHCVKSEQYCLYQLNCCLCC